MYDFAFFKVCILVMEQSWTPVGVTVITIFLTIFVNVIFVCARQNTSGLSLDTKSKFRMMSTKNIKMVTSHDILGNNIRLDY